MAIAGGEVQSVHHPGSVVVKKQSPDHETPGGYLDRYGTAIRLHSRARYYFPVGVDKVYLEGGLNTSHFPSLTVLRQKTDTRNGHAPIAGVGLRSCGPIMDVVIDYHYQFRYSSKSSLFLVAARPIWMAGPPVQRLDLRARHR